MKKIADIILYSNLFIGLCAVALTLTNQLTVGGEMHFDKSCWFIFFSTVFTYSYLKVNGSADGIYKTGHRSWAAANRQLSKNILFISLIATVAFFFLLERKVMLIVAALGAVTAFYGFVEIPFITPKRKLRDLGLLKTAFVGIIWSVTTVIVPLAGEVIEPGMMVFLLLRRFLFLMALTMVFEIKDMEGDSESNLSTLPLMIGVSNTKLLAQGLLFALMIINAVQYFFFDISLSNMLAVNLSLLVSIICIQPVKEDTPEWWYYFVLDGMMIVQFLFVWISTSYLAR